MHRYHLTGLILLLTVCVAGQTPPPPGQEYFRDTLQCQWMFTAEHTSNWKQATVPGCVHTDLLNNRLIADPFLGTNEEKSQWVSETVWIYRSEQFDVPKEALGKNAIVMRFNGIDTYADIFLNDELILQTDNAFRSWEVNVKPFLKKKGNQLTFRFKPTLTESEKRLKQILYPLPGDGLRAVTRKPQFQFGCDWAPRLISCGISAPIEWMAWDVARFEDVYIRQDRLTDREASLTAVFELNVEKSDPCSLFFYIPYTRETYSTPVEIRKGLNLLELPFTMPFPRLWWCNDQGDPWLYTFHIWLKSGDKILDQKTIRKGIRTIDLVTERDSIGEGFGFELNGLPVFAKGANMVPLTYFPAQATDQDYRDILLKCKNAHFNMIRVWGGGTYEKDIFYDLCDEMGIMVWQDFMFANSMYPADSLFITNVIAEANEQTRRLRNHACMALWCGNSENSEGWENGGWQFNLQDKDKTRIKRAYDDLFLLTLEPIVEKNTHTAYWTSSPLHGRADKRSLTEGDCHYWGVWDDEEPIETFKDKIPRFMSEFGLQSFPSPEVLRMMCDGQSPNFDHHGIPVHEKYTRGFKLMKQYMNAWYPSYDEKDVLKYAQLTQVVQAEGMCMAIEAQRRAFPRCTGSLFWQLNDVWPAFSWSSIDVDGIEKLSFTMVREAFAPQLISYTVDSDELKVFFINDDAKPSPEALDLFLAIRESNGKELYSVALTDYKLDHGVTLIFSGKLEKLIGTNDAKEKVIIAELRDRNAQTKYRRYGKLVPQSDEFLIPTRYDDQVIPELLIKP